MPGRADRRATGVRNAGGRRALVVAVTVVLAMVFGGGVAGTHAVARAADNPDPIAGICFNTDEPGNGDMPALAGESKEDFATWLINIIVYLVQREHDKGADAQQYADDIHDCFPQYNVLVAQKKTADTVELHGLLASKRVDIDGSKFWLYIFRSGSYTKPGDLGYKNWAWSSDVGKFQRSDDDHTVTFSTIEVTPRSDWYTSGTDDYDTTAKCSINQVNTARLWVSDAKMKDAYDIPTVGEDSVDWPKAMKNAVAAAQHCWPDHNVAITKDPGTHAGSNSRFDVSTLRMSDGRAAYTKSVSLGQYLGTAIAGYTLHVFDKGEITVQGDGGWVNWGYSGAAPQVSSDHKKVTWSGVVKPDFNAIQPWYGWKSSFTDSGVNTDCSVPTDGSTHDGLTYTQVLLDAFHTCEPEKKFIAVKHSGNIEFIRTKDLRHVFNVETKDVTDQGPNQYRHTWDVYSLDAGIILNSGDAGYQNWAAWGASGDVEKVSGGYAMTFEASSSTPGSPTGDETNVVPDLAKNSSTFRVDTGGGSSFAVSQPKDSVATYLIKDGAAKSETLTAADGSRLKYAMDSFAVSAVGDPSSTITVDPSEKHQTVDGFGGAMTSSAAQLIGTSSKEDEILSKLYGTGDKDAGLTIARSPMGSSDLQASDDDNVHTYEDSKGAFSVDSTGGDKRQISVLKAAKAKAGGGFKLLGTPWTAPAWAKKGSKLTGNACGTDENELDRSKVGTYAQYFADYVSAYSASGLKPWMVSMQNEPENCKTQMPTTLLNADDEVALSKALRSTLPSDVGVLGWDHNWNDPDYVKRLVSKGNVDAIGYHCYDGTHYGAQTTAKKTLMTECSGFDDSTSHVASNLGWEVANLLIGPMRNGSTGSVYWSLAQNSSGGPHLSTSEACQNCRGLLTVNSDGSYTANQDFYYYGQFGKFVRPGAVRIGSNNSGDLSTVAFRNTDGTIALVVLNSSTHADGGTAGSSESDYRNQIVQWDNNGNGQNPSWMVGADGYRRWISDISTYQCLKDEGGIRDAGTQPGGVLDKYINLKDVWAVCGASVMGTNSELEKGTYLKSGGGAKLSLGSDGKLVAKDSGGKTRWSAPATGDRLILQPDGNLVLYSGDTAVWATGTDGKAGAWLSIRDDGSFIVSTKANKTVWTSAVDASSYKGQIVQWDGDSADQKTSWQVGYDGKRRVIHDWDTFKCLHDSGEGDSQSVSSDTLDALPDLNDVWATCGADRMGAQGMLAPGSSLKAGDYRLVMQTNGDLVLWKGGNNAVWSTKTNTNAAHYLTLQSDGNLVEYDKSGKAVWSTGTKGKKPGWLVLGDDGSLRLYDSGNAQIWSR